MTICKKKHTEQVMPITPITKTPATIGDYDHTCPELVFVLCKIYRRATENAEEAQ
jgi:hypothetical protein